MRRTLIALLVAVLVLATPAAAEAAKSSARKDPQGDVIGGGGGVDMKQTKLQKKGKKVVVTFTSWNAFADGDLAAPGGIGIDFRISKKLVRGAAVRHRSDGVYGQICSYDQRKQVPRPKKCSMVPVQRVSDTAYRMTLPIAKIDKGARSLSWKASAYIMSGYAGCTSGSGCLDGVGSPSFTTWKL